MRKIFLVACLLMLVLQVKVSAQDIQFSQFYAAPLYLNPAFAGSTEYTRVGINYRNQWPSFDANFTTTSIYADHYLEDVNSGIGAILTYDKAGLGGLRSYSFGFQYAYELRLSEKFTFRPGAQIAYYNRSVQFNDLLFGDQIDANTGATNPTTGEVFNGGLKKGFVDLTFGGLLFSKNAWFGATIDHLTEPNQSIDGGVDPLPRKLSIHGGYKFFMKSGVMGNGLYARPRERSITPTFQYKSQGEFDQMDLGMYATFEPIIIGLWYRGLPFKKFEEFNNNESIVFLMGFTKKAKDDVLHIGYSFDFTISELGPGSGGAHEFSLSYAWSTRDPRKPPKHVMQIPCPDF
jgi:type IX secretion system PorP/SprF family membrane protein